jgi:pimeloyl-ACP methyl ester carboxylesterase
VENESAEFEVRSRRCEWTCQTSPVASKLPPAVLMHGMAASGSVWQDVAPLLAVHHEVFTPTALGHGGGPPVQRRAVRIWDAVDAAEAHLDEAGLDRPHLAGNSMGAFVAIELARRAGRSRCVRCRRPGSGRMLFGRRL